jgi:hypothetical protein
MCYILVLVVQCWYCTSYLPVLVSQSWCSNLFSLCQNFLAEWLLANSEVRKFVGTGFVRQCLANSQYLAWLRCDKVEYTGVPLTQVYVCLCERAHFAACSKLV